MTILKNELLRETLSRDLNLPTSQETVDVVDDAVRKVFTVNKDGAVLSFAHSQPNADYWIGVKHYGSGSSSRIRIRRTSSETVKSPKSKLSKSRAAKATSSSLQPAAIENQAE